MRNDCHADLSWIKITLTLTSLSQFKGQWCFLLHYATPTHPPHLGIRERHQFVFQGGNKLSSTFLNFFSRQHGQSWKHFLVLRVNLLSPPSFQGKKANKHPRSINFRKRNLTFFVNVFFRQCKEWKGQFKHGPHNTFSLASIDDWNRAIPSSNSLSAVNKI